MIQLFCALGMCGAIYAGPQVYAGAAVDQSELSRCGIDFQCQFDWARSGYDGLVPALESFHYRPGFWKSFRRSTNVEIPGEGRAITNQGYTRGAPWSDLYPGGKAR